MEEHDTPDPEFIKGFNDGYLLAKHLPDLSKQLGEVALTDQRSNGFKAGRAQMQSEREKAREPQSPWWRLDYAGPEPDEPTPDKDAGPSIEWERDR